MHTWNNERPGEKCGALFSVRAIYDFYGLLLGELLTAIPISVYARINLFISSPSDFQQNLPTSITIITAPTPITAETSSLNNFYVRTSEVDNREWMIHVFN